MNTPQQRLFNVLLPLVWWWLCCGPLAVTGEIFTLGYLTGSQRRPGNLDYPRPGLTISGAISLAVNEINGGRLRHQFGHTIAFLVGETYGEEVSSIRQTASLWSSGQVAGYIGPQETCVHEGRMAAAFNLPMISYVSVCVGVLCGIVDYFACRFCASSAPTRRRPTRRTSRRSRALGRPTRRFPSQWSPCCSPTTGRR